MRRGEDGTAVRDGGAGVAGVDGAEGGRTPRASGGTDGDPGALATPDRVCYALFSRHADRDRHRRDRRNYRGADLRTGFDVLLARTYGLSWVVAVAVLVAAGVGSAAVASPGTTAVDRIAEAFPLAGRLPTPPRPALAAGVGLLAGGLAGAADRIDRAVPDDDPWVVDSERRVALPDTIRGREYEVRAAGRVLVLAHPTPGVGGRERLALPAGVRASGAWSSDAVAVVRVRGDRDGLRVRLVERPDGTDDGGDG